MMAPTRTSPPHRSSNVPLSTIAFYNFEFRRRFRQNDVPPPTDGARSIAPASGDKIHIVDRRRSPAISVSRVRVLLRSREHFPSTYMDHRCHWFRTRTTATGDDNKSPRHTAGRRRVRRPDVRWTGDGISERARDKCSAAAGALVN